MKAPSPRFIGRGYQMRRVIYPNWVGAAEINGRKVTSEIKIYLALTRFTFKTDDSYEGWLLDEEGGRGFTLQLYGKGMSTEAIVNSFFEGADFYARVPYKERKRVSYAWHFPEPDHIFPVVTLQDVDFAVGHGRNIQKALYLVEKFKQVLINSQPDPNFAKSYKSLMFG